MNGLPNSESRRANGKLRSEKADDALATIKVEGDRYPPHLAAHAGK